MARIAIYSRKSKYTGKGESIENQIEMCREYIFNHIPNIRHEDITVYEDEGFSAKTLDRPQFQKMLKDAAKAPFDYVVCYRLDRISRSVSDFSALIEDLARRKTAFICIKEQFDTSTPMGRAMMYIASVFAQLERETIAERVRDNMLMLARTGRWLGGTPPTGFTSEKVEEIILEGKTKSSCKLKWNLTEIRTVKTIFAKFMELGTLSGVSKYLIKNNIRARSGQFFSLPGLKEILSNPVYCMADKAARDYFLSKGSDVCFEEAQCSGKAGLLAYNKRDYTKKNAPRQDENRWIIAIGKHKGIVSGKNWSAIQEILAENKTKNPVPKTKNDYALLSGMISCSICGSRLFAKNRHNSNAYDYICSGKLRGGTKLCGVRNLNGQETDEQVWHTLLRCTKENEGIYPLLEQLKERLKEQEASNPLTELAQSIKKCQEETERYLNVLAQPHLNEVLLEKVNTKVQELHKTLNNLYREQARLEAATCQDEPESLIDGLAFWKDHESILSVREKRQLLKILIERMQWNGRELHIFLTGC